MAKVTRLPSLFRRNADPVSTDDPRIGAVIRIQEALSGLSDDECIFVIQTVQTNLDLNRRHRTAYAFED